MNPSNLLWTKFYPPRPRPDFLPRPHLLDWLASNQDKRLILISAPPGYGKTTLIADFINASTIPYAFCRLDAQDSDPTAFLTVIIEAFRNLKRAPQPFSSPLGKGAQSLMENPSSNLSPLRVMTLLINEITEQIEFPCWVILEDYQTVTSTAVHQLVEVFIENSPENLHIILSSRVDPPLPLSRWRARGQMAELRASSLRFREEETIRWMKARLPGLNEESLRLLNEKTEGWVAALQLVRSSLKGRDAQDVNTILSCLSGSQQFVFEYFADEVFKRLSTEKQMFLLRTAILDQMDCSACDVVAEVSNAQVTLENLERQNLFVSSLDAEKRWFRYHSLFREFLLNRLQRQYPQEYSSCHRKAAEYYEIQGEPERAFTHYLAAGDYEGAVRAALLFARDFVERGKVEVLHRYLSSLPEAILKANPELMLQDGNALLRTGQSGLAISRYEDAKVAFMTQGNLNGVCRTLTRLAEIYRAQGNYHQAEQLATEALSFTAIDHVARAKALMALAKSTGFLQGMDRGRQLAEEALQEARLAGEAISPLARANFLQSLGQICWWHGDPQATVRYCLEALRIAPEELSPISAQACISLATPYLYWREFDQALYYAERALHIAQSLHLKELLPSAYTALGNVLTRLGEIARAEASLRQAMALAQELGVASYEQLMATGFLAYNLCEQGRVDEARQLIEGVLWSYSGNPDTYEAYVCRSVLADIALEKQQFEKAEQLYMELVEIGERRQFRIPLALVYLGLSYIHLETGRQESGLQFGRKAIQLIEATRTIQLFIDQGIRSKIVSENLMAAGEKSRFLERVLEHFPEKQDQRVFVNDRNVVCTRCFGQFRVFVNGEEIAQERWISAKARDLLAFFVTMRNERIPADRAYDAIWGEKGNLSRTAFHTALSRLRNALKTGQDSPRFILVESGEYWLDLARFKIDVDLFDAAIAKARSAATASQAYQWYLQAVSLVEGEYLQNLYYEWVFPERRRLSQVYLHALHELAAFALSAQMPDQAVEFIEKALLLDPIDEENACLAMRAYAALGNRAAVNRIYHELKQCLQDELGANPLPKTTALYQSLIQY